MWERGMMHDHQLKYLEIAILLAVLLLILLTRQQHGCGL
jgi:hypothetical protein